MKILLDSSPLAELALADPGPTKVDVVNRLKLATLLAEGFLLHPGVQFELSRFIQVVSASSSRRSIGGIEDLETLLTSPLVSTIAPDVGGVDTQEERDVLARLRHRQPRSHSLLRVMIDAKLIAAAQRLNCPIYTLDRSMTAFGGQLPPQWYAPVPFDVSALRTVSFSELVDLSAPLRAVYQATYQRFREVSEEATTAALAMKDMVERQDRFRQSLEEQNLDTARLRQQLLDVANAERFWRDAARPKLRSAIAMSALDVGLGLLPFPFPSSLFVYLYERSEYARQERQHPTQSVEPHERG